MGEEPHPIQFGEFVVDPEDRRLIGPSGPIHLGGRAFDVLCALLRADGRLVSKDQLFAEVWKGLAVSDAALTTVIRELRLALGDQGNHQTIKAIYGQGYRLEGPVSFLERSQLAATSVPGAPSGPKLAVLPFDDLSPKGGFEYLADGISQEILSTVAQGSRIRTISKLSSFAFRGADKARAEKELGATHILDGSVRVLGERIRITIHLSDLQNGETAWSDTFDGVLENIFEVQASIARSIARIFDEKLKISQNVALPAAAYKLWLQAERSGSNYGQHHLTLSYLDQIIAQVPDFAPAWGHSAAVLADLRTTRPLSEWGLLEQQALSAIEKARSLDPKDAMALSAEFRLAPPYGGYHRQAALLSELEGRMGDTAYFHFLCSWHLCQVGFYADAVSSAQQARELDPLGNGPGNYLGMVLGYSGDTEAAREILQADLSQHPHNQFIAVNLMHCASRLQDRALFDMLCDPARLTRYPLGELELQLEIARIAIDDDEEARKALGHKIKDALEAKGCFDLFSAGLIASYLSPKDCHDLIADLPVGPAGNAASNYTSLSSQFVLQPGWAEIRQDKRFARLCGRIGLAQYWVETEAWPDCADKDDIDYDFRTEMRIAADQVVAEPFTWA